MLSRMLFAVLLLLLTSLPFIQSNIQCLPHLPLPPSHPNPSDHAADCRFLLSHLPAGPFHTPNGTNVPFSTSVPFHPKAYIRHGSCEVQMLWEVDRTAIQTFEENIGGVDLRHPPIVAKWVEARVMGGVLVTRCVENGLSGLSIRRSQWIMQAFSIGASLGIRHVWDRRRELRREMMAGVEVNVRQDPDPEFAARPWSYGSYDV